VRGALVAGEPITPLGRLLVMADAASGIGSALDWTRFTFVNVDFSVALERPPEGEWMAMDARTEIGDRGAGVCTGVLFDRRGRVGVSTQALFVAAR
jgi:acyl-CoA thioesterase